MFRFQNEIVIDEVHFLCIFNSENTIQFQTICNEIGLNNDNFLKYDNKFLVEKNNFIGRGKQLIQIIEGNSHLVQIEINKKRNSRAEKLIFEIDLALRNLNQQQANSQFTVLKF